MPIEPAPRASWHRRVGFAAMTAARFALAFGMFPYGISKLLLLQFQVGASIYAQPLGSALGPTLTWAFLGYSPAFQFLLGACEIIPATLLLFARTRRLGALLLFPVLLNVTLINYFLDLWAATRIISSALLALNVFLILYDYQMYLGFLSCLVAKPEPIANRKLRLSAKIASFVVPAAALTAFGFMFHSQVAAQLDPFTDFIGRRQINRAGSWTIDSLQVAEARIPAAEGASLYFDFNKGCVFDDGVRKERGTYDAKRSDRTFHIDGIRLEGTVNMIQGSYKMEGDRLFLNGRSGKEPVSMVLRRDRWGRKPK